MKTITIAIYAMVIVFTFLILLKNDLESTVFSLLMISLIAAIEIVLRWYNAKDQGNN